MNPYQEIIETLSSADSAAGAAYSICMVQAVDKDTGSVLKAKCGELELVSDDLIFCRHIGACATGQRLLCLRTTDEQHFYVIGVF